MKRFTVLLVALTGALACQDSTLVQPESPTAADLSVQAAAQAAITEPISAIIILMEMLDPGVERPTGNAVHRRDQELLWRVTGEDLVGTFQATGDWIFHDGIGPGHGAFVMDLTYPCTGTFEGNWHGGMDPYFKGKLVGQGKGGCKGKKIKGSFEPLTPTDTYPFGNFVQSLTGSLQQTDF